MVAARDPQVRKAFEHKITPERITKEMEKMFGSRSVHVSVQQMFDFGITSLCFKIPDSCTELHGNPELVQELLVRSVQTCNVLGVMFNTIKHQFGQGKLTAELFGVRFEGEDEEMFSQFQKKVFYAGLLLPFDPYQCKIKNAMDSVVKFILSESLKQSNDVQKFVS